MLSVNAIRSIWWVITAKEFIYTSGHLVFVARRTSGDYKNWAGWHILRYSVSQVNQITSCLHCSEKSDKCISQSRLLRRIKWFIILSFSHPDNFWMSLDITLRNGRPVMDLFRSWQHDFLRKSRCVFANTGQKNCSNIALKHAETQDVLL